MTCAICSSTDTRPYLTGQRCPAHTPAATYGRPEATVDPARTLEALRAAHGVVFSYVKNDTAARDERARRLGQSVSGARRRAQHAADAQERT